MTIAISQIAAAAMLALFATPMPAAGAISKDAGIAAPAARDQRQTLAQMGSFRERLRQRQHARMEEVERDLEKNPNLVDDPKYLEQHPKLARYLEKHPEAKAKIKRDPKGFFQHLEERQQRMGG